MQEHTKTHPIDDSHLLMVSCPCAKLANIMELLKSHGCAVNDLNDAGGDDEDIPIEEVLTDRTPGTILQGLRYRENLTQEELAKRVGIPRRHISDMENNRRPIGKQNAKRIAEVFGTDPRVFLWV